MLPALCRAWHTMWATIGKQQCLKRCKTSLSSKSCSIMQASLVVCRLQHQPDSWLLPGQAGLHAGLWRHPGSCKPQVSSLCMYIHPLQLTTDAKHRQEKLLRLHMCCLSCLWDTLVQLRLRCSICYSPSTVIADKKGRLLSKVSKRQHATCLWTCIYELLKG